MTIPPPDADGYWHYTYVTYHPGTGEWYGGKHTTSRLDDGYLGSGKWVRNHPTPQELVIEITEFFYSEEHAYVAEAMLVDFRIIEADPLCRNEIDGGMGLSRKAASKMAIRRHANPEWRTQISASAKKYHADPEWRRRWHHKVSEANRRAAADPEWQKKRKEVGARNAADPEWRRKNLEVGARNAANPEWQRSIREGIARRDIDPKWLQGVREGVARRNVDPVWQKKMREIGARNAANPEWLRRLREGLAKRDARLLEAKKRKEKIMAGDD